MIKYMRQLAGLESGQSSLTLGEGATDWKKLKDKMNDALNKSGLDGNKSFESIGKAINAITAVLSTGGMELDDVPSADLFKGAQGRRTFRIAKSNTDDPFSPESLDNTMLVIQWYTHASGNKEVTAYLS